VYAVPITTAQIYYYIGQLSNKSDDVGNPTKDDCAKLKKDVKVDKFAFWGLGLLAIIPGPQEPYVAGAAGAAKTDQSTKELYIDNVCK
jgi:hypothetical protein